MHEAVKQYTGLDFMAMETAEEAIARRQVHRGGAAPHGGPHLGQRLYEVFDQKVEEKLIQPTFITMHPVDVSPLAKRSPNDPRLTERFELFICTARWATPSPSSTTHRPAGPVPEAGGAAGQGR